MKIAMLIEVGKTTETLQEDFDEITPEVLARFEEMAHEMRARLERHAPKLLTRSRP